jgi:hypothetical protein
VGFPSFRPPPGIFEGDSHMGRRPRYHRGNADDFPRDGDELVGPQEFTTTGALAEFLTGFGPGVPVTFNKAVPSHLVVRIIQLDGRPVLSFE